jgi:hypothetical protein
MLAPHAPPRSPPTTRFPPFPHLQFRPHTITTLVGDAGASRPRCLHPDRYRRASPPPAVPSWTVWRLAGDDARSCIGGPGRWVDERYRGNPVSSAKLRTVLHASACRTTDSGENDLQASASELGIRRGRPTQQPKGPVLAALIPHQSSTDSLCATGWLMHCRPRPTLASAAGRACRTVAWRGPTGRAVVRAFVDRRPPRRVSSPGFVFLPPA